MHASAFDRLRRRISKTAALPLLVLLAACGGSDDGDAPAPAPCRATLESLHADIFVHSCTFDSCHGNNAVWDLWLDAPDLSAELVKEPARTCDGWLLVTPGSPDRSFLYHKLVDEKPPCGDRMPLGGALSEAQRRCVRDWIQSLAP